MNTRGALLSGALLLWPSLAAACPVCFDANEANRDAFVWTTVFLSLLPLTFIGGVVTFLYARSRGGGPHDAS